MTTTGPSVLSWIAAAGYAMVVFACLWAAMTARAKRQPPAQLYSWVLLAVLFAMLIYLRVNNLEEFWRDQLRDWVRSRGAYGERRGFQVLLTVGIIGVATLAAFVWTAAQVRVAGSRRSLSLLAAQVGAGVMMILIALRMVSFHALDGLLYGPLKLNWVGDIGAAALVLAGALYYVRLVQSLRKHNKTRSGASD
jgi:hypothetical protein